MKKHVQTVHEKNKPFKCSKCDIRFNKQCQLKEHFESVHEGKKHYCPHCDAKYSQKATLIHHMKNLHKESSHIPSNGNNKHVDDKIYLTKPFQCLNCSESFVSKY